MRNAFRKLKSFCLDRRGNLREITPGYPQSGIHVSDIRYLAGKNDVSLRRVNLDLLIRQQAIEFFLERLKVVRYLDIEGPDKVVILVPEQHIGGAQILAKHINLGRPQDKDVRNVRITDRYASRRFGEHHDARLIQRHLHRVLGTAANPDESALRRSEARQREQNERNNSHPCLIVCGS